MSGIEAKREVSEIKLQQTENGGWFAMELLGPGDLSPMFAFTNKADLMQWLENTLAETRKAE